MPLPVLAGLIPLGTLAAGSVQQPATNEMAPGGPGRLCLRDSSLDLLEGETIGVAETGLHGMKVEISGPAGRFTYAENESLTEPATSDEPVEVRSGLRVTRHRRQGGIGYLFYGLIGSRHDGRARPVVWVEGEALVGGPADLAILSRVRTGPVDSNGCMLRYDYGFYDASPPGNAQ